MNRYDGQAMNTEVLVAGLSPTASAETFTWFHEIEKQFSRFLPDSELSRVNRQAGRETRVSERFMQLVMEALSYYEQTEGIFSPFLGLHMNRIGYEQTFERLKAATNLCNVHHEAAGNGTETQDSGNPIVVDLHRRTLTLNSQALLDFGGIAKGWSVQQIAMNMMRKFPDKGLIDAGGDMMAWNMDDQAQPWVIGVAHPYSDRDSIAKLSLKSQAGIATSSIMKRNWRHPNGDMVHHILDPRTALSAQSDSVQVTVIGKDLVSAEIYAKCLLILGSKEGPDWLNRHHPGLAYILIDKEGNVSASSNLSDYCRDIQVIQHTKAPMPSQGRRLTCNHPKG